MTVNSILERPASILKEALRSRLKKHLRIYRVIQARYEFLQWTRSLRRAIGSQCKFWLDRTWPRMRHHLARVYRTQFGNICFIGVTGSCGKTTTKELIGAILAGRYRGRISNQLHNGPEYVAKTIFTIFPWHRFCVHELGSAEPGRLAKTLEIFRPRVGVVTHVGYDHYTNFRSLEATAAEKGTLVAFLPQDGTAVLNADDSRVLAMRERTRATVITYGLSQEAMMRGEEASCAWPQRLSLTAVYGGERAHLQTQLLGEHWVSSVLAALATGIALGIPLQEGARVVERVAPVLGRMSPHTTPDGVTFILDTWKAPLWTIPACLRFLEMARARRKVAVIGTISDYPGASSSKYRSVARQAMLVADKVLFVGRMGHFALKARAHLEDNRIMAFENLHELDCFLHDYLSRGDLVLLKGSAAADHLERLMLSRTNDIACWRERCGRYMHCQQCSLRSDNFIPDAKISFALPESGNDLRET
jgi:UDP-N-acetylmuramoyl-tripeptide--D-alanyl-D-alanine ligase